MNTNIATVSSTRNPSLGKIAAIALVLPSADGPKSIPLCSKCSKKLRGAKKQLQLCNPTTREIESSYEDVGDHSWLLEGLEEEMGNEGSRINDGYLQHEEGKSEGQRALLHPMTAGDNAPLGKAYFLIFCLCMTGD